MCAASTSLESIIIRQIRQNGPMSLAEYMRLCLSHPEHGYYMKKDPFGVAGDFTTAPEISQIFGEMIGAWIADTWIKLNAPERFILLECGPGRGTLMEDALRVTGTVKGFHDAMQLTLLECSPVLQSSTGTKIKSISPAMDHNTFRLTARLSGDCRGK